MIETHQAPPTSTAEAESPQLRGSVTTSHSHSANQVPADGRALPYQGPGVGRLPGGEATAVKPGAGEHTAQAAQRRAKEPGAAWQSDRTVEPAPMPKHHRLCGREDLGLGAGVGLGAQPGDAGRAGDLESPDGDMKWATQPQACLSVGGL